MSDIPSEWAIKRARKLRDEEYKETRTLCPMDHAFARYIAEHEEPPVDPLAKPMLAALCEAFRQVGGSMIHYDFSSDAPSPNGEKIVNILIPELRRLGIELSLQEAQP